MSSEKVLDQVAKESVEAPVTPESPPTITSADTDGQSGRAKSDERLTSQFSVDCLPKTLRKVVSSLAERHGIDLASSTSIALGVAGAAVGNGTVLQLAPRWFFSGNLFVGIVDDDLTTLAAVEEATAPLVQFQNERADFYRRNRVVLANKRRAIEQMNERWMGNSYLEPPDYQRIENIRRVEGLRMCGHFLFALHNVGTDEIVERLNHAHGESLLAIFTEATGYTALSTSELPVLRNCWKRRLMFAPPEAHAGELVGVTPTLSAIAVFRQREWANLLSDEQFVTSGVAGQFIVSDERTPPISPPKVIPHSSDWDTTIRGFAEGRVNLEFGFHSPSIRCVDPEAAAVLFQFKKFMATQLTALPQRFRTLSAGWFENCVRVCLILHLFSEEKSVSAITANAAVNLTWQLIRRQLKLVRSIRSDERDDELSEECQQMYVRIQVHAPIKKRELFRKYKKQAAHLHEPTLALLVRRSLVHVDTESVVRIGPANSCSSDGDTPLKLEETDAISTDN